MNRLNLAFPPQLENCAPFLEPGIPFYADQAQISATCCESEEIEVEVKHLSVGIFSIASELVKQLLMQNLVLWISQLLLQALSNIIYNYVKGHGNVADNKNKSSGELRRKLPTTYGCSSQIKKSKGISSESTLTPDFPTFVGSGAKPLALREFRLRSSITLQHGCAQLKNLFGTKGGYFSNVLFPRNETDYERGLCKYSPVLVPRWCEIQGIRFFLIKKDGFGEGGYGLVAFYRRNRGSSSAECKLPLRVAMKISAVPENEIRQVFHRDFTLNDNQAQWINEFKNQEKLHNLFEDSLTSSARHYLSFLRVFGSSLLHLMGQFQIHTVMEKGDIDLLQFILERPTTEDILSALASAAKSLAKLHEVGFVCGDLKPENIMLIKGSAKFFDFDGSVFISERRNSFVYTSGFVGPQRLKRIMRPNSFDQLADDKFALGTIILVSATGKVSPFGGKSAEYIAKFNTTTYLQRFVSSDFNSVQKSTLIKAICGLLEYNEDKRLDLSTVANSLQLGIV